ncbi:MAG: hypothetical protein IJW30_06625 [Clostridia bacterium]|nr:hypothetical protein [Clostridia bacterium]MBQ9774323.1 hypothetical protein [Clostridia bacterium]
MDIQKIDKNFALETKIGEHDVVFYDVRQEPFALYGFYAPLKSAEFRRVPEDVARATSDGVAYLSRCTAGGRVRFCTDSRYIAIKAEMPEICRMDHMALTGSSAFDLYVDKPETEDTCFAHAYRPSFDFRDGYEAKKDFGTRRMRCVTINFPSYSHVKNLYIGLQEDAALTAGMAYRPLLPVVYYGSSITQGGCSSRPGNAYQNVVSQRMNLDFLNLGFSGAGKGEDAIVQYMATLPMSVFVSDYDHNAPTPEHLRATHEKLYRAIRTAHPDIPYIMLSRPNFHADLQSDIDRRSIIIDTYRNARAAGDQNVYFIDGASLFRGPYANMCTVDGCHPNDMGFALMADAVEHTLREVLRKKA